MEDFAFIIVYGRWIFFSAPGRRIVLFYSTITSFVLLLGLVVECGDELVRRLPSFIFCLK